MNIIILSFAHITSPSNKPTAAYDYYGQADYFQNFRDFADIKGKAKVGRY